MTEVLEPIEAKLQKLANENGVVILSFVAPYRSVKISPSKERKASIGLEEEFRVEEFITEYKNRNLKTKNLYLLINSMGGGVSSSYKIAKVLRKTFENVTVFVPHISASGGTLIALIGNKIIMGDMSELSPIDIQIPYDNSTENISTATALKSIDRLNSIFSKEYEYDMSYPFRAMADKVDCVLVEHWKGACDTMERYIKDLLSRSLAKDKQEDIKQISEKLIFGFPEHDFVI
ncbi:MAG: ATP-dependent Clp protease proteolytic subunit, partial [Candidatus Nanoarchaeia archaeon]|nr:ATP-dependent Clp protease proteolytic subunit [Candidatus Nanoarchaeia archaeon]